MTAGTSDTTTVVAIDAGDGPVTFASWVVDNVVGLFGRLREVVAAPMPDGGPRRIAVVVRVPAGADDDPVVAAGVEAVRGAVLSLAIELGAGARINVVVADPGTDPAATLGLLDDPDGDYVSGSTFDLRGPA